MRYRAQLGGQSSRDVLLLRLMDAPGRPVIRLHLSAPVHDLAERWYLCEEGIVDTGDEISEHMSGSVELPNGEVI